MNYQHTKLGRHRFQIVQLLYLNAFVLHPEEPEFSETFNQSRFMTLRQIGHRIGLRPSAYLRSILDKLIVDGHVIVREGIAPNRTMRYEFRTHPDVSYRKEFVEQFTAYFRDMDAS